MITLHCRPAGSRPTEVRLGAGLRLRLGEWSATRRTFAIVDARIDELHPDLLPASWLSHRVTAAEELKSLRAAEAVLRAMAAAGLDRDALLVVIGGGTVGDLGGLCGGLFLRGVETWQVPTTLLAMVDSCVGGKTAVNLPEGKNLVGLVHPPALVVVDPEFARDLDPLACRAGLAEAIKTGIGLDRDLFELLEHHPAADLRDGAAALQQVVHRCLAAKIAVVERDLFETGARRLLNLGHTLGHALEAHSGYQEPHGLCVAQGLHFALDLAAATAAMSDGDVERCRRLLRAHGHERRSWPPAAELAPYLARDKKVAGGMVHFALPTGIGRSEVRPMALEQLLRLLAR